MSTERTRLVAFTIEADGDTPLAEVDSAVMDLLTLVNSMGRRPFVGHPRITSWWVAEDQRFDGSDNDSAVFVTPGKQQEAHDLLRAAGLTPVWNDPRQKE